MPRAPRAKGQLREAVGYVWSRPDLRLLMVLVFFVATFGMNFQVTNALMATQVFHTGAGAFGLASTAFAVGALGGALLAARRGKPSLAWLLVMSLAFSLTEIAGSLMPDFVLFLILLMPDRADPAELQHGGELGNPAEHHGGHARPGDGPVHAGLPGRHPARRAAGRVDRRGRRAAGRHAGGRRDRRWCPRWW